MDTIRDLFNQAPIWLLPILAAGIVVGITYAGYHYGSQIRVRAMRRLVKRKEGAPTAEQFVMQQAADGAMEIILSKRAYKSLKNEPLQGQVLGNKNQMVLRLRLK